jgi:hypothetical protein
LTDPTDLDLPFATWSLAKLAEYLVAEGVVTDISHEGLRGLLREEGVRFQAVRSWKRSDDPDFEAKRDRIVELYALAEAGAAVVICLDEFGPLNLQPQPRVLPLHPQPLRGRCAAASRAGQLQPAQGRAGPHVSGGQQRRTRLHAVYASWLNRIEAQFRALRYFTLAGTDHPDHATQARLIRRYIAWRNRNPTDAKLRRLINTANVA